MSHVPAPRLSLVVHCIDCIVVHCMRAPYCVISGLDIGLWRPLARGASESENPLAPQKNPLAPPKTCNDPNVFAAGIYDFTREVANFCTLGLYITKNKYELTLENKLWWPELARQPQKGIRISGHIANVKACIC